jgi:Raf kinase inhibitor-like YbhB/YbcL family protein
MFLRASSTRPCSPARLAAWALTAAAVAAPASSGCGGSPTLPSDPAPGLRGGVLATFDVSGERFRVWVTDPGAIGEIFRVRQGTSRATIPVGALRRGSGAGAHNAPWSWHLDPEDFQMAEAAIELCDGRPSYVETHLDEFLATVKRYCPWGARLVAVDDRRGAAAATGSGRPRPGLLLAMGLHGTIEPVSSPLKERRMALTLTSPDFTHGGPIPRRFTCEGEDVSPALAWTGVPSTARTLALIVDDPDAPDPKAPKMTWVHWVLYNLPASTTGLPAAVAPGHLPPGTREGLNDWKRTGYGGPCPPIGRHRYFFKLYALDTELPDLGRPTKARLEQAMAGHIVAQAELMGTYEKGQR